MPHQFATSLVPSVTGLDLGSPSQKWDGYFQRIEADSISVIGGSSVSSVPFSATPVFDLSTSTGQQMTLTGNVTSSSVTGATAGGLYVFSITQDNTGARAFTWPANFKGASIVDSTANTTTTQLFWFSGTNFIGFASAITT